MRRFLVTGGAGFIGSHFIEHMLLTYPDVEIVNLDALTYAAHPDMPDHLAKLAPDRYSFLRADIGSPEAAGAVGDRVTAVINFAAESHVDRSILDPVAFVRTNVLGTQNLLDAARKAGVRFVQVSTDEVYGTLEPDDEPFTESSPLSPNSPYAASKACADLMVLAAYRTHGQEAVITRCANNFGPYQFPEKLLPLVIANAIEGLPIPVYGDGKQVRDWIHVKDHCRGIDAVLQRGKPGEVYNISASEERPNLEVIRMILDRLGKPRGLIQFVGDRPAHDRRYGLDSTKLAEELGWKPSLPFEAGLDQTIAWYRDNQEWWRKVRDKEYYRYYQENYAKKFAGELSHDLGRPVDAGVQ